MGTAIVYYSMSGNTALIASKLAEKLSADLIEIKPVTANPDKGIKKFLWGGKSAVMAETPKLIQYTFNSDRYDQIIFGFPVWASNMAPPIRSFIKENLPVLKDKQIGAFVCQSGSGGEKALRKLEECLGQSLSATMILIDPKDKPKPENDQMTEAFAKKMMGVRCHDL